MKPGAAPLTRTEVLEINSLGPFNHSVWSGRGLTISHEETLTGRVEFLSASVRAEIEKRFSRNELSTMTCFDVGCFDGWLLESLSDLPFKAMVGIEPRAENIAKGRKVREILGIPSRVEYLQAGLDDLSGHACDILICIGVLHHVPSVFEAVRKLTGTKPKLIFLESILTPSSFITEDLKKSAELKDVVYRHSADQLGLSVFKYETMTYPGSAIANTVVEIATRETVQMALNVCGYSTVTRPVADSAYRDAMPLNDRPFYASVTVAERGASIFEVDHSLQEESEFVGGVLPRELVNALKSEVEAPSGRFAAADAQWFEQFNLTSAQQAVLRAVRFNPRDKIKLEVAKVLISEGRTEEACAELDDIVTTVNVDWRSCYRALYLLSRLAPEAEREGFLKRCLTCNPNFPRALFSLSIEELRRP